MINGIENEADNKNRSLRYYINKPMPRRRDKGTKYKMCHGAMLVTCIK